MGKFQCVLLDDREEKDGKKKEINRIAVNDNEN